MKKRIAIVMVALLIGGGLLLVRHKKMRIAAAGMKPTPATMVRIAVAQRGDLSITRSYLARILPWRSASMSAQITSRVTDIAVREGDRVSQGQVVARLDATELQAKVRGREAGVVQSRMQADAARATAQSLKKTYEFRKRELERDRRLVQEGAIARVIAETSSDRLNEIQGRWEAMKKTVAASDALIHLRKRDLEEAQTRLAYTEILAPFDGVVSERLADIGDMASPNRPLLTIEDHSQFKVCFDVPQKGKSQIRRGMGVVASPHVRGLSVSRIHPALNRDRTLTVECDTHGGKGVSAGGTLSVKLVLQTFKDEILLPEESLIPIPTGGDAIFIVQDKMTKALPVTILGRGSGVVAVRGVNEGAAVIQSTYLGWNRLAAGEPVEVRP